VDSKDQSKDKFICGLQDRIAELETENQRFKTCFFHPSNQRAAMVSEPLRQIFEKAQHTVYEYFKQTKADPAKGFIEIGDQRYILIRASALSFDFLNTVQQLYADRGLKEAQKIGKSFLFDIAHSIGISDARDFHKKMNLTDPISKLSAGPVHFSYCGWALVEIREESNPVADENFVLIYDHPYSFEADSWLRAERKSDMAVCIMSAGYSSGWCEESFGVELTSIEVLCRGKGDASCTFVMAPPSRIEQCIHEYFENNNTDAKPGEMFVPTYFDRKRVEEEREKLIADLRKALAEIKTLTGLIPICSSCKNIRDDEGYWHNVEKYVADHSEADFTHGICPTCQKKFYSQKAK
jgi:predicted hydrocarbon binding protein